jgi:pyruvate dehydrogenase E1 component alpha subunit
VSVDGTDFFAVYEAAGEIIDRARKGGGPALLECEMVRFYGHFEGDAQTYRGEGEVDEIRAQRDCIKLFRDRVLEAGVVDAEALDAIDAEARQLIDDAVTEAKAAPEPALDELLTDVYVAY